MLISEIIISEKTPKQTVEQAAGALKISMGQAWDSRISLGQVISSARSVLGKSGDGSGVEPADAVNQAYYQILQKLGPAPTKLPKDTDKPKKDEPKKDPKKKEPKKPEQPAPTVSPAQKSPSFSPTGDVVKGITDLVSKGVSSVTSPFKSGMGVADKYTKISKK